MEMPVAGRVHLAMRLFVAASGRRRVVPPTLYVGSPGGECTAMTDEPWYDVGLRTDLVTRAIDGLELADPLPWLTRGGDLAAGDNDWAWFAATRTAYARHGLALPGFFVVTRHGWLDLAGERRQAWVRVRPERYADGS